jgi:hypothetical protein
MRPLKIAIAGTISVVGLLLPWRLRVVYSEALGWIAQLVPPSFYRMEHQDAPPAPVTGERR